MPDDAKVRDELAAAEQIQIRPCADGTFQAAALVNGRWIGARRRHPSITGVLDALRARLVTWGREGR